MGAISIDKQSIWRGLFQLTHDFSRGGYFNQPLIVKLWQWYTVLVIQMSPESNVPWVKCPHLSSWVKCPLSQMSPFELVSQMSPESNVPFCARESNVPWVKCPLSQMAWVKRPWVKWSVSQISSTRTFLSPASAGPVYSRVEFQIIFHCKFGKHKH